MKAEREKRYLFDTCPKADDIETYASAFEEVHPGYGRRLVLLAFATGLRINELLALRHDSIDLGTGDVTVGDAYDNALMESIIGLFKTECIAATAFHDGPYRNLADVSQIACAVVGTGCRSPM